MEFRYVWDEFENLLKGLCQDEVIRKTLDQTIRQCESLDITFYDKNGDAVDVYEIGITPIDEAVDGSE